jgi:hypothetical protein
MKVTEDGSDKALNTLDNPKRVQVTKTEVNDDMVIEDADNHHNIAES